MANVLDVLDVQVAPHALVAHPVAAAQKHV